VEAHDAVDFAHLAVLRSLLRSQVTEPLDRCEVLRLLVERLVLLRDEEAVAARDCGSTYAAVGRALGVTRQAARAKFSCERGPPRRR
jgi:hypothetical protein